MTLIRKLHEAIQSASTQPTIDYAERREIIQRQRRLERDLRLLEARAQRDGALESKRWDG